MSPQKTLDALRQRIRQLERPAGRHARSLGFRVPAIDTHLREHGLPLAALHEVSGAGGDAGPAACAALFVAGILARLPNTVLWCAQTSDLFGPGLACAGLAPDRVLHVEAADDKNVFLVMEEALRHLGLSAVVGEVFCLPMTASRRLVLAAEKSGVMAIALRRDTGRARETPHNAACTRWSIAPLPSAPLPVPGLGRARWDVKLTRCRGGIPKSWIMEACDAQGFIAVPADLADGQGTAIGWAPRKRVA
jgi:protein ImuA